jgi:hypothetical protein
MAVDLEDVGRLVATETGLATLACTRADGSAALSVVNAGLLPHPVTGANVVGLVTMGGSRKLDHLRSRPQASIVWRRGWNWAAVEGTVQLIGPDDELAGFDPAGSDPARLNPAGLAGLLRAIFTAAGGSHDDWDTFDRVMAEERRTAVLISPARIYGQPLR